MSKQLIIGEIAKLVVLQIFENIKLPKLEGKGNEKKEWIIIHPGEQVVYETKNPDKNIEGPYITFCVRPRMDQKFVWVGFSRKGLEENYKGKINLIDNAIP